MLRTPISRRLEDGSGEQDLIKGMNELNERAQDRTQEAKQTYNEAQKALEYEMTERPEYRDRKAFVEAQRKKALSDSHRYAKALLQHYQERRYNEMKQSHL